MASGPSSPILTPIHSAADTLQAIERQTRHLQKEIQTLLDAQSVGLLAGLGREVELDNGMERAARPAHSSDMIAEETTTSSSKTARKQPSKRRPSLSTSRNRIGSCLTRLGELKQEESAALEVQYQSLSSFLLNAVTLVQKKVKIEQSIEAIDAQTEGSEERLVDEEKSLTVEIASLETQLEEANTRLKHVRQQNRDHSNRRNARLSSWQGALEGVDQKIKREVLDGRGLENVISGMRRMTGNKGKDVDIWNVPRERRTAELMGEDVARRMNTMAENRETAEYESKACQEGAGMWKSAIMRIDDVERNLAEEIESLTPNDLLDHGEVKNSDGMVRIVDGMTKAIEFLEHELDTAERRGWNVLVCAMGAEVEALKQGKDLLQETLRMTQAESTPGTSSMMTAKSRRMASDLTTDDELRNGTLASHHGSSTNDLLDSFHMDSQAGSDSPKQNQQSPKRNPGDIYRETKDESPNLELLLEHND